MSIDNKIFLLPGEYTFTRKPAIISTLLGSCVGIALYDKKNQWGGMNHFMLPNKREGTMEDGKFGDASTHLLLKAAYAAGVSKGDLVASIYGGGQVIGHLGSVAKTGGADIGAKNIAMAKELMKAEGIRVIYTDVGGNNGRRIGMDTSTNEIECKLIQRSDDSVHKEKVQQKFASSKIKVLIIDDSATVRKLIREGLEKTTEIEVVGEAENPYDARALILEVDPDVLCLDIIMPRMDGLTFLKKIMQYKPIPTVICSTIAKQGSKMEASVKEAGAVDVIDKEDLNLYKHKDGVQQLLVPKLVRAASVKVG